MNTVAFIVGLVIFTLLMGFATFLAIDHTNRESKKPKKKQLHEVNPSRPA